MKGKFIALTIILLMVFGSFSAASISYIKNEKSTEEINYLKKIAEKEGWTFEIGLTSVSGKNIEELCGFSPPDAWWKNAEFNLIKPTGGLPDSFDWRSEGGSTPVKDQGNCGSCWAFGTIAPLESAIKIKEGKTVDLSEQWLVSCNQDGWGCDGGWWAHDYHQWKTGYCGGTGAVYEEDFPYTATDGSCQGPYDHYYILENWAFIASESSTPQTEAIKQAIYTYGPVSAAVTATNDWSSYTGGIYNNDATGRVNHAITLVGWDDSKGSNGCWILKNSWGPGWGENGYMYIEYGCSNVGYAACYVDGYRGPPTDVEEKITFTLQEITNDPNRGNFEGIEPKFNRPEWYYRIGATISGEKHYHRNYNMWWEEIGNLGFYSEHTWVPEDVHDYITGVPEVEFTIKLMDDDQFFLEGYKDDLADVSKEPGGGVDQDTSDHRPSIYHGTYNLVTNDLTGDWISDPDSKGFVYTIGDGINNAKVWFKIEDTYNGDLYEPDIQVSPSALNFGEVEQGSSPSKSFTIKNTAEQDTNNWADTLDWSTSSNKDWIDIDKNSGSISGGNSDSVAVTINTDQLERGESYSGKVTVNSNDESKEITVDISIKKKAKTVMEIDNFILDIISFLKNYFLLKLFQ